MTARHYVEEWLAQARITDGPAGDLIADMRRDRTLPRMFRSIAEMRSYLLSRGSCPEAIAATPIVWTRYRRWLDRHPLPIQPARRPPKPSRDRVA